MGGNRTKARSGPRAIHIEDELEESFDYLGGITEYPERPGT